MFSVSNSTKELSDAGRGTAVLSVGFTEQCGPHLHLNIDTLVAEYHARAWGAVLNAYVLPTMPFNTSEEHASFKGIVSLGPSTVMMVLEEIVEGLRAQGFRKQVLTVGHGGALWLRAFVKHVNRRFGDTMMVDAHRGAGPVWEEALRRSGLADRGEMHGDALSRALALHLAPGSVTEARTASGSPGGWERSRTTWGGKRSPPTAAGPLRAGGGLRGGDGRGGRGFAGALRQS